MLEHTKTSATVLVLDLVSSIGLLNPFMGIELDEESSDEETLDQERQQTM
jgi:hypothetical protein